MNKNHFSLYRLCLVCFSILLLALPLLAEANSLEIKCQDPSGNPIVGANVQIQPLGGRPKDKKSDSKGMALFNKLDDGAYRILARKEGFAPALYEFAFMKGGSSQSITLKFEQGDAQKKVYFEDPALGQKAIELLNQGSEQLRSGKFADAEKTILASLEIYPSNAEAQFNLSIAYLQNRKWGEAEEMLKRASQLLGVLSSLPPPKDGRAFPYGELRQRADGLLAQLPLFRLRSDADKALSERKFDVAAEKYAEALKTQANDPDLYYNLALAQAQGRHFDDAMQSIDKAIQLKPGENAYADLKKRIADFKENEILNKAQGFLNEGDKLFEANDYAGALAKYEEAQKLVPEKKQGPVVIQIAKAHAQLNHYDQALAAYKKAIELAPDSAGYRTALAQFYIKEKKYDEALNIYADPNAAGNQPVDQVLFKLGQTQSNQGNSEVAQLAFERAIKTNTQNAEAYYELGMLLYQSKKADKQATEILTKYLAIGQDPAHKDNAQSVLVVLKKRMK
jgi:tetratricopeptide (TPR) repeat protein